MAAMVKEVNNVQMLIPARVNWGERVMHEERRRLLFRVVLTMVDGKQSYCHIPSACTGRERTGGQGVLDQINQILSSTGDGFGRIRNRQ